jgi:hypothetical protein
LVVGLEFLVGDPGVFAVVVVVVASVVELAVNAVLLSSSMLTEAGSVKVLLLLLLLVVVLVGLMFSACKNLFKEELDGFLLRREISPLPILF